MHKNCTEVSVESLQLFPRERFYRQMRLTGHRRLGRESVGCCMVDSDESANDPLGLTKLHLF